MRQVEKFNVSSVEQQLSFNVWCRERNVQKILFDGDDTLWKTVPIFRSQMEKCYDLLAKTDIMPREDWKNKITEINNALFEEHGVNPNRWDILVGELAHSYPLTPKILSEAKNIFSTIYQTPPQFIEGTEAGLNFLKNIDTVELGVITHAGREWTWKKYQWLKLDRFLNWDDIFLVDENGHKTKESWQKGMEYHRVNPENCLVVGDSPRADINPVCELGVEHCFLVQNRYEIWSLHQQAVDENKTMSIESINDLRYLGKEIVYRR